MRTSSYPFRIPALAAALRAGACAPADGGTEPAPLSPTGSWVAVRDPAPADVALADTFRFSPVHSGTRVTGTWETAGPSGRVVKPGQKGRAP